MSKNQRIAPESNFLLRRLKRLHWSLKKRLAPERLQVIPFDRDLFITARPIDRLARRVYLDGYSDRDLAALIDAFVEPGMTVFDVGAHFGQYTLMAAKRTGKTGRVHCFEPTRDTFRQLVDNIRLNGFQNVYPNQCALYNQETELELNVCSTGMGEFNSIGNPLRGGGEIRSKERIRAMSLDTYCSTQLVDKIDFMKIDVEGAELAVVQGARKILSSPGAPVVVAEFNEDTCRGMGYSTAALRRELHELGYTLFQFNPGDYSLSSAEKLEDFGQVINLVAVKDRDLLERVLSRAVRMTG